MLLSELARDAADALPSHDFGRDLIPSLVARGAVAAHPFDRSCVNMAADGACWRDVGTVDAYRAANMDLIQGVPQLNLYDDGRRGSALRRRQALSPARRLLGRPGSRGRPRRGFHVTAGGVTLVTPEMIGQVGRVG